LSQNFIKKTLHPKKETYSISRRKKKIPKKKNTRSTKKHPRIRMKHKEGKKKINIEKKINLGKCSWN
jgi:hypothetical protein